LVGPSAVVSIVIHAVLLVIAAVLAKLLLAVNFTSGVVLPEALIVSVNTRFVVSRLAEVSTGLIVCLSAHILCSFARHVHVKLARRFFSSAASFSSTAPRSYCRTRFTSSRLRNRLGEVSLADVGAGGPDAIAVNVGGSSQDHDDRNYYC